ncbi:putative autophagy-related protein 11 isoform X1 [Pieris napi]|uniref:putative autophagy-related protein 11 isoform X1 n=1 Tax=Pieris napi TaxID=78633 RepID=UPI001FBAFED2|nr:putative autophagy-related protein 11 isoform X1 [Pieris napi]
MKTIIVLSALATIAIAVPVWENGNKQDPQHNAIHKTIKRERKSTIQESPADLSLDNDGSLTGISKDPLNHKAHGFRKPVIVKKKFGYQIFRDSDEELAQAQPRENCRRQFRFKLCDESDETAVNNMRTINTENVEERDVQHSLKMAKEAVEILQRDLQKIEESTKTMHKNHFVEDIDDKLHRNIEHVKEASQLLNQNIANLDTLALKAVSSKEISLEKTDSLEEARTPAGWMKVLEKIQKNKTVTNIEDTFKTAELSHALSAEDLDVSNTKHIEKLDTTHHTLENNEKTRANTEENTERKLEENIQHKNAEVESNMESYATEAKQTHASLHSDSLKLDNARNWDITENVRHAETNAKKEESNLQEFNNDSPQHNTVEEKSVHHTDADDFQDKKEMKKTDIIDELEKNTHTKIQHEKSVHTENNEKLLEKSNNFNAAEEVRKHNMEDKTILKSAEDKNTMGKTSESIITAMDDKHLKNEVRNQEKDSEASESRNIHTENMFIAKEALNKDSLGVEEIMHNEKKSIESNLNLLNADAMMRSADDFNNDVTSFKNAELGDASHLQMREAIEPTSDDKKEKSATEKEHEINTLSQAEDLKEIERLRSAMKTEENHDKTHKTDFEKSAVVESTKIHEHVDSKTTADKQINHNNAVFQKSVDLKNTEEKNKNFAKDQITSLHNNNEKMLEQGNSMRFVDEYGDRNLPVNAADLGNDYQQRMSEMDYFNNMNSQHNAQLEADKNLDFHTSSHINQGMSEWDRNQQHYHSMLRPPPFMPWMHDRLRSNIDSLGNHQENLGNMQIDHHQHEHHFNNMHSDGHHHHHHHALPMGRFVNNIQTGINHDLLNGPMMRENMMENGGAIDLDSSMQPSMKINMRDALDQNGMKWNYQPTGKSGFGSGTVGVFPNANSGCGIPLLLSCSPSVVSGSLAKQSSLGFPGHNFRSGDDMRFYTKRDAQGINEIKPTNLKNFSTTS